MSKSRKFYFIFYRKIYRIKQPRKSSKRRAMTWMRKNDYQQKNKNIVKYFIYKAAWYWHRKVTRKKHNSQDPEID